MSSLVDSILAPAVRKATPFLLTALDASLREAEAGGMDLARASLTSVDRSFLEQLDLYQRWKSGDPVKRKGIASEPAAPGLSGHHRYFHDEPSGLWLCGAVDIDTDAGLDSHADVKQAILGQIAEKHGLLWGGRWSDPVHYQIKFDKWEKAAGIFASLDRQRG